MSEIKIKLRPCPFCASTNLVLFGDMVECLHCHAQGPTSDHWAEAAELWDNRRTTERDE